MTLSLEWPNDMLDSIAGWILPRARRIPHMYRRSRQLLETGTSDEVLSANLSRVLRVASQLPGYAGLEARVIHDFPFLTKSAVRSDPQAYCKRTLLPISRQQTSGSSGLALGVARSLSAVVFEQATVDWIVSHSGLDLRYCRTAVLRGADIKSPSDDSGPFWRRAGQSLIVSSNHVSRQTIRQILAALRSFRPDVLLAYPSTIENFVHLMKEAGLRWRCPLVLTSSEVLSARTRLKVASALSCDVYDYYGQAERVACAYSIEPGRYWLLPSYSHVELLRTGEAGKSEIVGTPFHNMAQVLVRYRTGDHADTGNVDSTELRMISAGRRPFSGISGRSDDVLLGADGRILVGIDHIPRGLEQLGRFQFIQDAPDHVRILVQSEQEAGGEWTGKILRKARLKIPNEIAVDVEFVPELVTSAAGKTPFVIRDRNLVRADADASTAMGAV